MGIPKPQGPACDNIQESFHERKVRPMLVAHGLAMKLNLCIFKACPSSKTPWAYDFFCLENTFPFVHKTMVMVSGGSCFQVFSWQNQTLQVNF